MRFRSGRILAALFHATLGMAFSQTPSPQNVVRLDPIEPVKAKPGSTIKVALPVRVDEGFHVNSNKPADEFLIPLRLTWGEGVLQNPNISFPKPQLEHYGFSDRPVSVFTGNFQIVTSFKVARDAAPRHEDIVGKLHFQACNEKTCLTPKTIDFVLPLDIVQ